jgi:hypothetical protein
MGWDGTVVTALGLSVLVSFMFCASFHDLRPNEVAGNSRFLRNVATVSDGVMPTRMKFWTQKPVLKLKKIILHPAQTQRSAPNNTFSFMQHSKIEYKGQVVNMR